MLNNLYSLASHSPFAVVFDRFSPHFREDYKFDLTINLGTNEQGDFNFPINIKHEVKNIEIREGIQSNQYQRAANGGTFDHLHFGHKILLSISLLAVSHHLTIGVTGEALLQKKKHVAFLQSYQTRVRCVQEFCQMFRPEIDLLFSELIEPAGPTKDGKYEALIATEETAKSLEYINSLRENQGLNKLEGYIIKLIGNEAQKLSSTDIREQISKVNRISDYEYLELKSKWLKVSPNLYWFESIIVDYYSQPHRHYHTLRHIYDILTQLKTQTQILAAFFHDVIYYPKIHDNEERSSLLFEEYAKEVNLDSEIISIFILQTKSYSIDVPFLEENDLSQLMEFLDADLSILESPGYAVYAQDIRREYSHYSDNEYKTGRIAVLQTFLNKKIFLLRDDAKARKNILEEIEALQNWQV